MPGSGGGPPAVVVVAAVVGVAVVVVATVVVVVATAGIVAPTSPALVGVVDDASPLLHAARTTANPVPSSTAAARDDAQGSSCDVMKDHQIVPVASSNTVMTAMASRYQPKFVNGRLRR
jgi:hypothetical protein